MIEDKTSGKRMIPVRKEGSERPPGAPAGSPGGSLFGTSGPVRLGIARGRSTILGSTPPQSPLFGVGTPGAPTSQTPAPPRPSQYVATQQWPGPPAAPETVLSVQDEPAVEVPRGFRSAPSAPTSWSPSRWRPRIERGAFVHPLAVVTGNVIISDRVFIASGAMIRGDSEEPIFIGAESNVQECAVLKDMPTRQDGAPMTQRIVDVGAEKFSLYIGKRVSITPQAQVHGPAYIGDRVYVGMQSLVFWARVEEGVVIEPGCLIMNVTIPTGVFVPAGLKVTNQRMVKDLPPLTTTYRFHGLGEETVMSNLEMLVGYRSLSE